MPLMIHNPHNKNERRTLQITIRVSICPGHPQWSPIGILNSNSCCFFSISGVLPTFPNAFSISISKFPFDSRLCCLANGGVGSGGLFGSPRGFVDFVAPPSDVTTYDPGYGGGVERFESDKSSAGGRDFISLALAREIKGTVDDEITGAIIRSRGRVLVPVASSPMLAFMRASTHPLNSTSFSALKMWTF
jgi:hypothetical protein